MKQEKGFTLIELIVVIVILGILAATALPKFSNISADARAAKMNGLVAALRTAAAVTHGQTLVKGNAAASSVTMDDGTIVGMSGFFPDATSSGIANAIGLSPADYISAITAGSAVAFYPDQNHANTGLCGVSYVAPTPTGVGTWTAPALIYNINQGGYLAGISSGQCI